MITRRFQIWLAAGCITLFALVVVWSVDLLFYPRDDLFREVVIGTVVTISLAFPMSWFMAWLVYRNARLNVELQRLLNRDRLTDAATRDYFFAAMEADPDAYGVSLIIDIDEFKTVNDTHGHLAGDRVIRKVAQTLKRACRDRDIVCRFGGEEFVVFLFDTSPDRGRLVAERMRQMIETAGIEVDGIRIPVTVSIGASLKDRTRDIASAIREADAALYEAKRSGRNRAIMSWADAA